MRARAYAILQRAVEEGVAYGYQRAHKHVDSPDGDAIKAAIEQAVMDAICEVFEFEAE